MRIVSLVPSITATIADLGLETSIVGCTNFCIAPPGLARRITVVGGTKDPDLDKIMALAPDRILVNTEENRAEDILACRAISAIHESFPKSPHDVPAMISSIANFVGAISAGQLMADQTTASIVALKKASSKVKARDSFLYLIWRKPWMAVGSDTYISRFLEIAGLSNALLDLRYPQLSMEEIIKLSPKMVFFSSEPWPFRKRDYEAFASEWQGLTKAPLPKLLKIDGKAMSWHGSQTQSAATSLRLWIDGHDASKFIRHALPNES